MSTSAAVEQTPREAGLDDDQVMYIALRRLADDGGKTTLRDIAQAVEAAMNGADLSAAGRTYVEQLLQREGVSAGYVQFPEATDTLTLTAAGRDRVQSTATEAEETTSADDDQIITKPFNPADIRVATNQMTVFQVMRKIKLDEIRLDPEFQRNFVWDEVRQSRLIESILLRIPLPAFYLDATNDDRWQVVDGLQRLTTLDTFYNKNKLRLHGLEHLTHLEGKTFDELPRSIQRTLEEKTFLTLYIIEPDTPRDVKFMIFSRVNTGGLTLTAQEIRHALNQGPAAELLKRLAETNEFLQATTYSISPLRMDDRECVLRFLAFYTNPYQEFGDAARKDGPINLDQLLNKTMQDLNQARPFMREEFEVIFRQSMVKAKQVFGAYAFRKMYYEDAKRYPISKPLFEVWSVLLTRYQLDQLEKRAQAINNAFRDVMNKNTEFTTAISLGTGSIRNIRTRFSTIETLLQEVMR